MCARYGVIWNATTLMQVFGIDADGSTPLSEDWSPDYNIAPTDPAPVVFVDDDGRRQLDVFRWGLVPFWSPDTKGAARMINARSDTVATKPAFKESFAKRRLLVPATGWYEWRPAPEAKKGDKPQPFWMHDPAGRPLAFAGLWAKWKDKTTNETRRTFSILTTDASPTTAAVHDRMPVILTPAGQDLWLSSTTDQLSLLELLHPFTGALALHPVAKTVNSVRADGPELIVPITPEPVDKLLI